MLPICMPSPRPSVRRFPRAQGFGLLQVMLLVAVMAGLSTMGYLQWSERTALGSARQERQALAQADRALMAFATVMRRLPCPATARDGLEDCTSPAQKGWLPSATLRLAGADPGVDVGQLRYLVQRQGGENDLTILTDVWRPFEYDDAKKTFSAMRSGSYPTDILTLTDLCQRLDKEQNTSITPTSARVNSTPLRATAYALAHPGNNDADGDGDIFDGANALAAHPNLMEDPARRPLLAQYNDVVLERSYASLLSDFQCAPLLNSINTVALGHDVAGDVAEMQADNIESAKRTIAFSTLAAVMTTLEIAMAIPEGISDGINAAAEFAACAASLGLAVNMCAAAPQHVISAGLTAGVVAANGVAVGLNVKAAILAGTALRLADSAATPDQVCPPPDKSLNNQMLKMAQDEVTAANTALGEVNNTIQDKTTQLNTAKINKTSALNDLNNLVNTNGTPAAKNAHTDLLTAADSWGTKSFEMEMAQAKALQAQQEVDRLPTYNAILANPTAAITRLNNEIAALDSQISANPANKQELENERARKQGELTLAKDPALLTTVRDEAQKKQSDNLAALEVAKTARDTATQAFNTVNASYQTAYANLVAASGSFETVLKELFGPSASSGPSTDAKYLKPVKLQKELDAMIDSRNAAGARVTSANTQLLDVQQRIDNPPACNVTGSAVVPMTPEQAESILIEVDTKGGIR